MAPPSIAAVSGLMRQVIHYHLDNHNLNNALFFAERLQAHDPRSNESAYLVALCHYRLGDSSSAHSTTKLAGMRGTHLGCSYIFANACLDLDLFKDGISALEKAKALWTQRLSLGKHAAASRSPYPDAPAVLCLLGKLYRGFNDQKKAVLCFEDALKANPFMWDAVQSLCEMNQDIRVGSIYKFTESLFHCFEPDTNVPESREGTPLFPLDPTTKKTLRNGVGVPDPADPFDGPKPSTSVYQTEPDDAGDFMARLAATRPRIARSTASIPEVEGVETPTAQPTRSDPALARHAPHAPNMEAPPPLRRTRTAHPSHDPGFHEATSRMGYKVGTKRGQRPQVHEDGAHDHIHIPPPRANTGGIPAMERKRTVSGHPRAAEEPGAPQRRSARLNGISRAAKAITGVSAIGVTGTRELKKARAPASRILRPGSSGSSGIRAVSGNRKPFDDSVDIDHAEAPRVREQPAAPPPPIVKSVELESLKTEEALKWILELMKKITSGYYSLSKYHVEESLKAYGMLPPGQKESPWVLAQLGRALYEKADYTKAETAFKKLRHVAPTRTEDMEVYSTILWFLKKDVELSYLAHEMVDLAWDSPQAWCTLGNAMSATKDHEGALKSFKRATQLDPQFAYAYTLQGHEHIANEEYDRALTCYRSAISADPRHYNGYYGIGRVYEKLGQYDKAFTHFQRAATLNGKNAVLMICIGNALEKQRNQEGALHYYRMAVELSPHAPQARYKMARVLLGMSELEQARDELLTLKDLAPDEANVHFLLGKLYKSTGQNGDAIRHFTIALNLDPRASSQIKEAIESLEDDDAMDDSMIG